MRTGAANRARSHVMPPPLNLDERQRAMLAEMGVRVWAPAMPTVPAVPTTQATEAAGGDTPAATGVAPRPPAAAARTPVSADASALLALPWPDLQAAVAGCRACGLCAKRQQAVFGVGPAPAAEPLDVLLVGEAPGEQEDLRGEPFVGKAGELLDLILHASGMQRGQGVFITNAVKCRPPANRNPEPQEMAQCAPYLAAQIAALRPRLVLAMGRFAVQATLGSSAPIGQLRGQVHRLQHDGRTPVVVTYHPAYLLRQPQDKARAWADWCLALDVLDAARAAD
jgi:uracil-DNA glycosylase